MMNWAFYQPSEMELWINSKYKQYGIHAIADMNIDHIAAIFNTHIAYTQGETKVLYDSDGTSLIFLNVHSDEAEQRVQFFHELCHPALHAGDQRNLPPAFISLQESQAAQFQRYAAMPIYLIEAMEPNLHQEHFYIELSEMFTLPLTFVRDRIEQIQRRIQQEQKDRELRSKLAPKPTANSYSDTTIEVLNQLNRQLKARKGAMNK